MAAAQPPRRGQSLQDLRDELLATDPVFRAAWEAAAPRRRLVTALVRLRHKADLTQQELATRAGWDRAVVRRLESLPRDSASLEVTAAVSLIDDARFTSSLATWPGRRIGIRRRPSTPRDSRRPD